VSCQQKKKNDCHKTVIFMPGVHILPSQQKMLQSQSSLTIFLDFILPDVLYHPLPPFCNHLVDGYVDGYEPIRTHNLITLLLPPFTPRSIRARPFSRQIHLGHIHWRWFVLTSQSCPYITILTR